MLGDVALMVAVLLAQLAPFVSNRPAPGHDGWEPAMFLPILLSTVPVVWRRKAPFAVLIATEAGAGLYAFFPQGAPQPIWYGALLALFTLAAQAPWWQRITALVFIGWGAVLLTGALDTAARGVLLWVTVYALGRAWAARGAQTAALKERARHLERARELEAALERARIAREMHDVLGHGMSVMIAQAEAGPVFVGRDDARVTASFDAIAGAGREAMAQLRRVLGVLGDGRNELVPAPTLAGLPDLTNSVERPGFIAVHLAEAGEPRKLPADVEAAAYRIVQEGLTNVLKHARPDHGAVRVDVALAWTGDGLTVRVTDDGVGARGDGAGTGADGAGRGLTGIAERAAACGGQARWGAGAGGKGFRVEASLPAAVR
ncbi:Signal transduction histidine kinase [Micromonospora eburnea]|uniref:histidine kinase n=1 Tax=Micromonospora eburnea TaxID=227316 RepID=A0A1C6V1V5_9ACTN|nr:Signal transduction histidine kinase [Micromonospora eburnea]